MRTGSRLAFRSLAAGIALLMGALAAHAQAPSVDELLSAVVRIKAFINPDGRTVQNLGHEREGSGIVIDSDGLVLTIGYLMVEAHGAEIRTNDGRAVPANIVGYDHDTGFGLLRAIEPLKLKPMPIGKSGALKERDPVLVVSFGGAAMAGAAEVVSKREFAGSWEYLLDDAIFTAPLHPLWSGAALISREGRLVGVGSLVVGDARGTGGANPGNMFVPIDGLPPILADLIADGKPNRVPRPWLGLTTNEENGRLIIARAVPGSPAEKAGVERGAVIVAVNGEKPKSLGDFYRKVWALGRAGATVPIEVTHNGETRRIDIQSMDRLDHLKLKSTF